MAHRRRKHRRRHARENPLSDTTKIVIAVGVTAVVVGTGYYFYKRSQAGLPLLGSGSGSADANATRGQPPPGANAGGSSTTDAQKQQQIQSFKLGDAAGSSTGANTGNQPPGTPPALYQKALNAAQIKFAQLWSGGEIYAFQMAIGAVQALGVRPEDVINIATDAVQAYWLQQGAPLAKAKAFATGTRDNAGFGPLGAAGGLKMGGGSSNTGGSGDRDPLTGLLNP